MNPSNARKKVTRTMAEGRVFLTPVVFQSSRPHRKFALAPMICPGSRVEPEVSLNKGLVNWSKDWS